MVEELTGEEMAEIAGKLVKDSLRIGRKPDGSFEAVRIMYNSTDPTCVEFALKVEEECWKAGAHTLTLPYSSARQKTRFTITPGEALAQMNPMAEALARTIDISIFIGEEDDPGWSRDLASRVRLQAPHKQKLREILDERRVRWAYVGWPIPGAARGYECPLGRFRQIFFNSIRQSFGEEVKKLCDYYRRALEGVDQITIKAEDGTNLTFSIKGRPLLVDDAYISEEDVKRRDVGLNIPTGEVFIAPLEDSANGTIRFERVAIPGFGKIRGLKLVFEDGRVVEYEASEGCEVFTRFLEANTGDKDRIAELGIGCNPGAEYTGGSIIVDEKIYGTLHIAIGSNTGAYHGKNKASSHLDLIKDMEKGTLLADGKIIMHHGKPVEQV
jgi:aminopeptidase